MQFKEIIPEQDIENYTTEFKARLMTGLDKNKEDNELKWLKEIVAFANNQGGTIFVGVNDATHEIEPMTHQEIDATTRLIYQKVEERIEPTIDLTLQEIAVGTAMPGKYLLRIDVEKNQNTPVYVHTNGIPACFIRQFGRAKIATPEQIANLVIKSTRISYDSVNTDIPYDEDKFQALKDEFVKANPGKSFNNKLLESIGILDGNDRLTKGGLLFKDDNVDDITLIKASKFSGFNKGGDVVLASETYRGCLLTIINKAVEFVKNHSTVGYQKTATSRIDLSSYPSRALFEGIVNAFAHRNYFIAGSEIQVDIFPDRLEITSPGSLIGGKRLEQEKNIAAILPKRRNEAICRILEAVHYMEAKGTGFDKIAEEYRNASPSHQPFVTSNDDFFTLTLPDLTYREGVIGKDNPYPDIHLVSDIVSPYDEKILSCCFWKSRSIIEIGMFLNITPSTHLRKDILEKLVEKGYLFKKQIGKANHYLTNRELIDPYRRRND